MRNMCRYFVIVAVFLGACGSGPSATPYDSTKIEGTPGGLPTQLLHTSLQMSSVEVFSAYSYGDCINNCEFECDTLRDDCCPPPIPPGCWRLCSRFIESCRKNCPSECDYLRTPEPFEFNSEGNREGWILESIGELTMGPSGGTWALIPRPFDTDPKLVGPLLEIDTSIIKKINIRMVNDHHADTKFQLFWATDSAGWNFSEAASVWLTVPTDGVWREYTIDLSSHPQWRGTVYRIRMDPVTVGNGNKFIFDYVRFLR